VDVNNGSHAVQPLTHQQGSIYFKKAAVLSMLQASKQAEMGTTDYL